MLRFTFTNKDIVDGLIQSDDNAIHYTTSTTSGINHKPLRSLSAGQTAGAIDWRTGVFDIGGVQRPTATLKHKNGGFFSSEREWMWSGKKYIVKPGGDQWTATRRSDNKICAIFTLRKSHIFKDSEPATITFPVTIPAEDVLFLIMVMIYSVTREADKRSHSDSNMSNASSA
ncbi:hypothetical protein Hypma_012122 [Hypsizygus marmoreus]|uniref:Uncharacterized protein n=1 Tax=Hypsizygus marmoreus TaxID=39966 RepID=A0A369JH91_HYPMA|nr:hypothetical protein Hypma_012122 [Hypsizygus marmoreus]